MGPQSAGSAPGPACYGRGGTQPTITDAALILGYLDSSNFVSGRLELRTDLAEDAFRPIADALGRTVEEAAYGAMLISVDNIVTAIREKTVTNGIDLREVTLVAGGGASGLNVGHIARSLGLTNVLVPKTAGAMSAYGALHSPAKSEFETVAFSSTRERASQSIHTSCRICSLTVTPSSGDCTLPLRRRQTRPQSSTRWRGTQCRRGSS